MIEGMEHIKKHDYKLFHIFSYLCYNFLRKICVPSGCWGGIVTYSQSSTLACYQTKMKAAFYAIDNQLNHEITDFSKNKR